MFCLIYTDADIDMWSSELLAWHQGVLFDIWTRVVTLSLFTMILAHDAVLSAHNCNKCTVFFWVLLLVNSHRIISNLRTLNDTSFKCKWITVINIWDVDDRAWCDCHLKVSNVTSMLVILWHLTYRCKTHDAWLLESQIWNTMY